MLEKKICKKKMNKSNSNIIDGIDRALSGVEKNLLFERQSMRCDIICTSLAIVSS